MTTEQNSKITADPRTGIPVMFRFLSPAFPRGYPEGSLDRGVEAFKLDKLARKITRNLTPWPRHLGPLGTALKLFSGDDQLGGLIKSFIRSLTTKNNEWSGIERLTVSFPLVLEPYSSPQSKYQSEITPLAVIRLASNHRPKNLFFSVDSVG